MRLARRFLFATAVVAGAAACADVARETETPSRGEGAGFSGGAAVTVPEADMSVASAPASPPAAVDAKAEQAPAQAIADPFRTTMLIRNGTARVEVDSLELAMAAVRALAARVSGYVTNVAMQSGDERFREATLTIRIPAARFDEALAGLAPLGKVEAVNVTTEDVGEEYVDVQMRLANARRLEERLLELLAARTAQLDHILTVERELARVREQIERYEGRLRYLRSRVDLSTLTVTVHEPGPLLASSPGQNVLARALRQSLRNFVGFIAVLISSLGVVLPLVALGWLGWIVVRRVRRDRKPASAAPAAETSSTG